MRRRIRSPAREEGVLAAAGRQYAGAGASPLRARSVEALTRRCLAGGGTQRQAADIRFLEQRTAAEATANASEEAAAEEEEEPPLVSLQVPADEVCGCPLVRDVFELTGDFCRLPKRQCNRHYCWEKLRRAEVDLERVRVWYKLDELFEQERNVRTAMTNRAGLLALMLHQTIQHDPLTTDLRSSADR
ncbi:CXXC-type zinc finger protein 1 [Tupaia chinensis]|uniref:CXXC-type zinc finger protein 1 n=1 Tax=Tupaia chinensis TaxID=246437 RepID=UPI000FFC0195|nr:CXXC-type zinc finger protein 1 [Tupaia chinensis]